MKEIFKLTTIFLCFMIMSMTMINAQTWVLQASGSTQTFRGVSFSDLNIGTIVGTSGSILRTDDAGNTWNSQLSSTTVQLNDVHFFNDSVGLAVGNTGTVLKTTNSGAVWEGISIGVTNNLTSVSFVNDSIGTIVGSGGLVRRTIDGGLTWIVQTSGITAPLDAVSFINDTLGIATGLLGILRTTDAGETWTNQLSGVGRLYGAHFVDENVAYAVGSSGRVVKSTDGGDTWEILSSGITNQLNGVYFSNSLTGTAVGSSIIMRTTDGGSNWFVEPEGAGRLLYATFFNNENIGTAVGQAGVILRKTLIPRAPSNLIATPDILFVDLMWVDNADFEDGFIIERKDGDSTSTNLFSIIDTVLANVTVYSDTGLTPNTTYTYRVFAFNEEGESGYSNLAEATTFGTAPSAPTNLIAVVDTFNVNLYWDDNSDNELGFKIERKDDSLQIPAQWILIDSVGIDVTSYSDIGLLPNSTYSYRIFAYNNIGNSAYSNSVEATTFDVAPQAPSNLIAVADTFFVDLSWDDNSDNELGFKIERKDDSLHIPGTWVLIDSVSANVETFVDTGLTPNTAYSYRVFAYNEFGNSEYSDSVETVTTIPVELLSFTASTQGNSVILNWTTASETNNQGFEVERRVHGPQSSVGNWSSVGYVKGKGTTIEPKTYSFVDENLITGLYNYRLKQMDFDGSYSYSSVIELDVDLTPKEYALYQNYPNPFNPSTIISWQSPVGGWQTIKVYDVLGSEVATLVDEYRESGNYEVEFNTVGLSSGVYIYKLQASEFTSSKKMILSK